MSASTVSDQLRQSMVYIVGERKILEMRATFTKHFMDAITDEQRSAIKGVNVLPEVFVEWYRQDCPDFLDGLSRLSIHVSSLCEEHDDPCTFRPFQPWIVVFLDKDKPFPKRYARLTKFAGMNVYFYVL